MNFLQCEQGTDAWYAARVGVVTASEFVTAISTVGGLDEKQAKYVSTLRAGASVADACAAAGYKAPPTAECVKRVLGGENIERPSDAAIRYAADKALERISGEPLGEPIKTWILERGHRMEFDARMKYEARTRSYVTEAGICLTEDGLFGYSTDGLVNQDGLIEVKAPVDSVKIMTILRTGDLTEYLPQMQGGMWITGRKWCDFIMYVPALAKVGKDLYVRRVMRDDAYIDDMVERLAQFTGLVDEYEALLRSTPEALAA